MPAFPFGIKPSIPYNTGGRKFGASRTEGKRKHAGCDLIAPEGTAIYAAESGTLIRGMYAFYHGTYAIEIKLDSGPVLRYCEIKSVVAGLEVGGKVSEGQVIAYVGKMYKDSMLHFEMYAGTMTGSLTDRSKSPFQRRSDLIDPSEYLGKCYLVPQADG